jgi:hypothetical protein
MAEQNVDTIEEHGIQCAMCDEISCVEETGSTNGKFYCKKCYNDLIQCFLCSELFPMSELEKDSDGNLACTACAKEKAITCENCGQISFDSDRISEYACFHGSKLLCDYCYENDYFVCDSCRETYHNDDCSSSNSCLCNNCADASEECSSLFNHDYKPSPNFKETKEDFGVARKLFLGVELEFEVDGDRHSIVDWMKRKDSDFLYYKEDESLRCGIEAVSHPGTLNFHKFFCWEEIVSYLEKNGCTSHDAGNCGLHVHVNKDFFAKNSGGQDISDLKLILMAQKFWPEIVKFSRRKSGQIDTFCRRYDSITNLQKVKNKCSEYGKFFCINITPSRTSEFRIFNGTLRYSTLIATLEFVHTFCHFVRATPVKKISKMQWQDYLKFAAKYEFKMLFKYLDEKRLLPPFSEKKI